MSPKQEEPVAESRDQLDELLEKIESGSKDLTLSPFEYLVLKDHVKSLSSYLDEYEGGLKTMRLKTPIGGGFVYRGQKYVVRKMRTQTDWQSGYGIALKQISDPAVRQAIEDTVAEELTKDVSTAEAVY